MWQDFTNNYVTEVLILPIHVLNSHYGINVYIFIYIKIYFIYRLLPLNFTLIKMAQCLGLYSKPFSRIHIMNNSKTGNVKIRKTETEEGVSPVHVHAQQREWQDTH